MPLCPSNVARVLVASGLSLASLLATPAPAGAAPSVPEFAPPVEVATGPVGPLVADQATGDVNADGITDVVVTRAAYPVTFDTHPIGVWVGDGAGKFTDGSGMFVGAAPRTLGPGELVIADFNGDGRSDIYYADSGYDAAPFPGYQNTLVLSTPDGRLADATANLPPASDFSHSAAAADIDKDGDQDIYVGNLGSPPDLLLNDGSGHFARAVDRLPVGHDGVTKRYTRVLFLDVNGDGAQDLFLGAENNTPESAVLTNDGTGHFSPVADAFPPKAFGPTGITIGVATLDVNRDSKADLILGFTRNDPFYVGRRVQVLIGDGDGTFSDETLSRLPQQDEGDATIKAIRVADLNGDGHSDFASVAPYGISPPTALYLDDGTGVFRMHLLDRSAVFFAFLDANTDGRLDIFSSVHGGPCCAERHLVLRQLTDDDADGVEFAADNCPAQANPDQANVDSDAQGDACDPDDDGDAIADAADACPLIARPAFNGCPAASLAKVRRLALSRRAVRTGIKASCPAGATGCAGRAIVRHRGRKIGGGKLALSAGKSAAVSVPLNRRGRRLVGDGRKRKIAVALELTGPDLQRVTLTRTGRVRLSGVAAAR